LTYRSALRIVVAVLLGACLLSAPVVAIDEPIVVLVSIDGWRWDYTDRAKAPRLRALAAQGVRAEGLIPSFPPKTFPNHYTLVTGLYPEHHGIVSNTIDDPKFPGRFTMSAATASDPRWWGGEPVWITAMRQGQRAASMFWPGSEVAGHQPTYWRPFDDTVTNGGRVDQVLEWLALPADRRPSFVTLYFSEVDHVGHDQGPDSQAVLDAAAHVDTALGALVDGIRQLNLIDRTTFVVVSDHGMSQLSEQRVVFLDDYLHLSSVDVVEWSPNLSLVPRTTTVDQVYRALSGKHPALTVYRREAMPAALHYRGNDRIPPIIGLAEDGWRITSHQRFLDARAAGTLPRGDHGYDPKNRSMHGLFVVAGPRVRRGIVVPRFSNVHVYDFLCRILGVAPARNDGDPDALRRFMIDDR
jgi:predicted AlkP superfamily pyrophosphatase or phosphodiesterase